MKWATPQALGNGCHHWSSDMHVFPCTQCGLCCQNVHLAEETHFLDRGDGTCRHYEATSKECSIYPERPDICRVDRQYSLHYNQQYSWDEFVILNIQACELLQKISSDATG
ncbi:YkgJ family cysteine cluster protein [Stutzerimonas nitrititolerans]|uniref:YkgJ family cysteine cluster protein n=2 Tax=Stutzerimonas nitrititolerans TaxID=2482751 RepID=UPI0035E4228B